MTVAFDPNALRNMALVSVINSEPIHIDGLVLLDLLDAYESRSAVVAAEMVSPHDEAWEAWYEAYPRKRGKRDARKAFDRAVKRAGLEVVMAGLQRFLDHLAENPPDSKTFIPYPATWLNQDRWEDDYTGETGEPTRTDRNRLALVQGASAIGEQPSWRDRLANAGPRAIGAG